MTKKKLTPSTPIREVTWTSWKKAAPGTRVEHVRTGALATFLRVSATGRGALVRWDTGDLRALVVAPAYDLRLLKIDSKPAQWASDKPAQWAVHHARDVEVGWRLVFGEGPKRTGFEVLDVAQSPTSTLLHITVREVLTGDKPTFSHVADDKPVLTVHPDSLVHVQVHIPVAPPPAPPHAARAFDGVTSLSTVAEVEASTFFNADGEAGESPNERYCRSVAMHSGGDSYIVSTENSEDVTQSMRSYGCTPDFIDTYLTLARAGASWVLFYV